MNNRIVISHRGNLSGAVKESENTPHSIDLALAKGLHVEIDVRSVEKNLYLGHDSPDLRIDLNFLTDRADWLWVHCKNSEALNLLMDSGLNFFFHDRDSHTITSKGFVWSRPEFYAFCKREILVLPERLIDSGIKAAALSYSDLYGVCTDFPLEYMKTLNSNYSSS